MKNIFMPLAMAAVVLAPNQAGAMDYDEEEEAIVAPVAPPRPAPRQAVSEVPSNAPAIPADFQTLVERVSSMEQGAVDALISAYPVKNDWPRSVVIRCLLASAAAGYVPAQAELVKLHLEGQPAVAEFWLEKMLSTDDVDRLEALSTYLSSASSQYRARELQWRLQRRIQDIQNSQEPRSSSVRSIRSLGARYANLPVVGTDVRAAEAWPKQPVERPRQQSAANGSAADGGATSSASAVTAPASLEGCWVKFTLARDNSNEIWLFMLNGKLWMCNGTPEVNGELVAPTRIDSQSMGDKVRGSSSNAYLLYEDNFGRYHYMGELEVYSVDVDTIKFSVNVNTRHGDILRREAFQTEDEGYQYSEDPAFITLTSQEGNIITGTVEGVWGAEYMPAYVITGVTIYTPAQ